MPTKEEIYKQFEDGLNHELNRRNEILGKDIHRVVLQDGSKIYLNQSEWESLWKSLELPFRTSLNADEIYGYYGIKMK